MLLCLQLRAQYTIQPAPVALAFVSGAAKGIADVISVHYDNFSRVHPGANQQYWDPAVSWRNKYKNGDPVQGAKFPGSTTIFVSLTDAWHLCNTVNKAAIIGAITIRIGDKKRPFTYYLADFALYSLSYSAGFWLTYEIIYK